MMTGHWTSLTQRFPEEEQCLASVVAWQSAEVVARVKPASLVKILNRALPCGRNIYELWKRHHKTMFRSGDLRALELRQGEGSLLVLVYDSMSLEQVLQQNLVKKTLKSIGYDDFSLSGALRELQHRMTDNNFPHEIGFFLGYPIKDVLGFMGLLAQPWVANGPWKIYGDKKESLDKARAHQRARQRVRKGLEEELRPLRLFQPRETLDHNALYH